MVILSSQCYWEHVQSVVLTLILLMGSQRPLLQVHNYWKSDEGVNQSNVKSNNDLIISTRKHYLASFTSEKGSDFIFQEKISSRR